MRQIRVVFFVQAALCMGLVFSSFTAFAGVGSTRDISGSLAVDGSSIILRTSNRLLYDLDLRQMHEHAAEFVRRHMIGRGVVRVHGEEVGGVITFKAGDFIQARQENVVLTVHPTEVAVTVKADQFDLSKPLHMMNIPVSDTETDLMSLEGPLLDSEVLHTLIHHAQHLNGRVEMRVGLAGPVKMRSSRDLTVGLAFVLGPRDSSALLPGAVVGKVIEFRGESARILFLPGVASSAPLVSRQSFRIGDDILFYGQWDNGNFRRSNYDYMMSLSDVLCRNMF